MSLMRVALRAAVVTCAVVATLLVAGFAVTVILVLLVL